MVLNLALQLADRRRIGRAGLDETAHEALERLDLTLEGLESIALDGTSPVGALRVETAVGLLVSVWHGHGIVGKESGDR